MTAPPTGVEACCAVLYGDPLVELLAGDSLHPGGLATTRRLLSAARLSPGRPILDAGCGLGAGSRLAALEFGLLVDACDVSVEAVRRAQVLADNARAAVRFAVASVLALPYADGSFSGALVECVLSTTTRAEALEELRRVIEPGGTLLISDVVARAGPAIPEPLASVLCLSRAWLPGELEEAARSAGFAVERSWDESPAISGLIDRIEARASLLSAVARDVRGSDGRRPAIDGRFGLGTDSRALTGLLNEIRRLVDGGQIGYRALIARAARPVREGRRGSAPLAPRRAFGRHRSAGPECAASPDGRAGEHGPRQAGSAARMNPGRSSAWLRPRRVSR